MSDTVFFSWQSDRPTKGCRNFIERALEIAADRLKADFHVEEAVRDNLQIDRDTNNVPGAPPIFDTIMAKIEEASVFVPDLTFVGTRDNGKFVSNPNVLIEYGLALRKPGNARIIAVMNDAFGKPTEENMPFNLRHLRFPITYTVREDSTEEERRTARKSLADKFESALRVTDNGLHIDCGYARREQHNIDNIAFPSPFTTGRNNCGALNGLQPPH